MDPKSLLSGMFEAAIDAARPALVLPPVLPPRPATGRVVVIAAAKLPLPWRRPWKRPGAAARGWP